MLRRYSLSVKPFAPSLTSGSFRRLSLSEPDSPESAPPLPDANLGFDFTGDSPPNPSPRRITLCPEADSLACLLIEHHNPFHAMESSLQLLGVGLSQQFVLQTLLRLRSASKVALAFFSWARDHALYRHNADAYEVMIDAVARERQFDVAWQLLVEMDQLGVAPTPRTFAILIRRYIAAGMARQAVRAFDDMEAFIGRTPDAADFNTLLDTLCKYGYVKLATELFNHRKTSYPANEKAYTILIYGWCKINRLDRARRFLEEISERGLEPNVVTYNVMLNGVCRKASLHPDTRFDRTIQAAENLIEEMHNRGIEPDVTSYSIIIHVYSRAHKPELTLCMFRSMKERGISPTIATYTSVIKCLASCGRMDDAEELINEMVTDGVCPSAATFNCFFKEYRGRDDVDAVLRLYKKMKATESLSGPDLRTYHILLGMFSRLNKLETVQELWNDMNDRGIIPDLNTYTLLIHGLCKNQRWKQACQFFMEMIEKGITPHKVTFETLYRGLIQADKLRTWRRLKNRVEQESAKFGAEFPHYHFQPYKR